MICYTQFNSFVFVDLFPHILERFVRIQKPRCRYSTERQNNLGFDDLYLLLQVWLASFGFLGFRVSVVGRPALKDVRNVNIPQPIEK